MGVAENRPQRLDHITPRAPLLKALEITLDYIKIKAGQTRQSDSGARGPTRAKGHRLTQAPPWDPKHFFGAFSFPCLQGLIFTQVYKWPFLPITCYLFIEFPRSQWYIINFKKKVQLHFIKDTFVPPTPLNERQVAYLLPSTPPPASLK